MGDLEIIGLISDTHGLMRQEALTALKGSDLIIYAGDVGKPEIIEQLRAVAPVIAVRGNIDKGAWASQLPMTAIAEARSASIYVLPCGTWYAPASSQAVRNPFSEPLMTAVLAEVPWRKASNCET